MEGNLLPFLDNLTWKFHIYHFCSFPSGHYHMTTLIFKEVVSRSNAMCQSQIQGFYYKSKERAMDLGGQSMGSDTWILNSALGETSLAYLFYCAMLLLHIIG